MKLHTQARRGLRTGETGQEPLEKRPVGPMRGGVPSRLEQLGPSPRHGSQPGRRRERCPPLGGEAGGEGQRVRSPGPGMKP